MRKPMTLITSVLLAATMVLPITGSVAGGPPVQGNNDASATSGGPIGYNFVISNDPETEVHPAVAYNSQREEYLVVWYNDRAGNDDIRAQRVSKNATLAGGPFYISGGPGADRRYPDVAYNSQHNEYLVVWEHFDGSGFSIVAQRVSATGQLQGGEITVESHSFPVLNHYLPAVAYAYTLDKYLVVWQRDDWTGLKNISGRVLSGTGTPEATGFDISLDSGGAPREEPDVAYNRTRNEYLVVWKEIDPSLGDFDIYGRRVQGNGTPLHPESIEIRRGGGDQNAPAVAAIPTTPNQGHYLVVWEDRWIPHDGDIHARRVTGEGNPDGAYFVISEPEEDQTNPAVAGNESAQQYLVVWTHPSPLPFLFVGVGGRAVSMRGVLLGQETGLGGLFADHTAVASGRLGDFLVAFDDPELIANRGIYGQLWGNRVFLPIVLKNHP